MAGENLAFINLYNANTDSKQIKTFFAYKTTEFRQTF